MDNISERVSESDFKACGGKWHRKIQLRIHDDDDDSDDNRGANEDGGDN